MSSFSFTLFSSLPRQHLDWAVCPFVKLVKVQDFRFRSKRVVTAISKSRGTEVAAKDAADIELAVADHGTSKRTSPRRRKKGVLEGKVDNPQSGVYEDAADVNDLANLGSSEELEQMPSRTQDTLEKIVTKRGRRKKKVEGSEGKISQAEVSDDEDVSPETKEREQNEEELQPEKKVTRKGRRKKISLEQVNDIGSSEHNEDMSSKDDHIREASVTEVPVRRSRRKKKAEASLEDQLSDSDFSDVDRELPPRHIDPISDEELEFDKDGGEDISYTYGWPPLVCCFGAAQHAFIPSGQPANRLLDYEMHDRKKDVLWEPEKFIRSPGGCPSNVAIALASLGGKVAFMGKLGDDDFGQSLLYYLNVNNVQTRSVCIDTKRSTAVSYMKVGKRGTLKMSTAKPCAEDSLSKSEINIDVLKEAKMFYFNTSSMLDRNMRLTSLQAVELSKKFGGIVFYDLNLPQPLWESCEETKTFIQQAWNLADIIEITKQELEFLCGIEPSYNFGTKDNDRSKFIHYPREVISPLWHDNLKILFVSNGTSKVHYYTKDHEGAVRGMEDIPITPFTSEMSASGDGIIAGLMRMLTVQPHLIGDKAYLERTINYAISCGIIDQWLQARAYGYPPKGGEEEDFTPDPNGIRSITESEYRTLMPVS